MVHAAALLTYAWPKGCWTPVLRPYTPITPAGKLRSISRIFFYPSSSSSSTKLTNVTFCTDESGHLDLLVKQYPDGKSSTHLHGLQPGQTLLFVAPLAGHRWQPGSCKHVTLIAGGAGITPIYQLARGILDSPADAGTAVTVVFGVNSDRDVLFKKEFDAYEAKFPGRFRAVYTVSEPVEGSRYRKGRVTRELLQEVAPKPGPDSMVFVSGPPAMETALVGSRKEPGVLEKSGYSKAQIYKF